MGWSEEFRYRDCPWCHAHTVQMNTIAGLVQAPTAKGEQRHWTLLGCPRCGGTVTLEVNNPNTNPPQELQAIPSARETEAVQHLPEDVAKYYNDAITVLDAGVPDAAAVQLRRTLEAAANHFEVDPSPLVKAIQKLIEKGLITKQFGEVLGHIRQVGNIGAHASDEKVTEETARRALRFTTQVLRNLREIPAELASLEQAEAAPTSCRE